jgi:hypothetical protein
MHDQTCDNTYLNDSREKCTKCGNIGGKPRYSFGIYAGRLCYDCCFSYRDHCGIDQSQGNPYALDENVDPI